jgi:hypothetical protein
MKVIVCISFTVCIALKIFGQSGNVVPANIRATNTLDRLFDADGLSSSDLLYGLPHAPGRVIGNSYWYPEWRKASLMLFEGDRLIEGYSIRYNIDSDELEIKTKSTVKVLEGRKVKSFIWIDSISKTPSYFINAQGYKDEQGSTFSGFFQVLSDGVIPLLKRLEIIYKKADYKVQFDVGRTDARILKKETYFYVMEKTLYEVPRSKKKLTSIFKDASNEIEKFIKINSIDVTEENHLVAIFNHYNHLLSEH